MTLSVRLKRTTCPIQVTTEASAAGNLGVRVKLIGSIAPSVDHIQSLIRAGGWNSEAVARVADEAQVLLQGLVKEYTERAEISEPSSAGLLSYLNERLSLIEEKYGIELITLAVQSLEPIDPEIADALRQQEQARLLEQTERLNHQARVSAARAKYQADQEIAEMEHSLELRRAELKKELPEKEAALAQQRLEDDLVRSRLRLAFEREELEVLKSSPELLMLTPAPISRPSSAPSPGSAPSTTRNGRTNTSAAGRPAHAMPPRPGPIPSACRPFEYPGHFIVKRITNAGTFRLNHKLRFLANPLKQQLIGLEETDDGVWSIHFATVLLGKVDERDMVIRD